MKISNGLVSLATWPFDRPLPPVTPDQIRLVAALRQEIGELPAIDTDQADAAAEWSRNLVRFQELVFEDDPRRFLRWDVIQKTMFVRYARYIRRELASLRASRDWQQRWRPALLESRTGHPMPYVWWPKSSANLIHHAYHLAEFERESRTHASDLEVVIEFGGGYGNCCRLFHRLGFSGVYLIVDLPQFSALQRFFLRSEGIPVRDAEEHASDGVFCVSTDEGLDQVRPCVRTSKSLFLATWSLSEAPLHVRERIRPIAMDCQRVFIAYQHQFGGIDNQGYFSRWMEHRELSWSSWEISHLRRNSYLLGQAHLRTVTPPRAGSSVAPV